MRPPSKAAWGVRRVARTRLWTLQDGTFPQLRRFVVKRQMAAECTVGHGKYDCAGAVPVARLRHRLLQHGADDALAADEHRSRNQHEKKR